MKRIFEPLEKQGRELLRQEGFADSEIRIVRLLDCRYYRQIFSVEVRVEQQDIDSPAYDWLVSKFEHSYSALYQHVHKNVPGFIDSCRVAMFGVLAPLDLPKQKKAGADPAAALRGSRRIYLGRWTDAPIYWFDDLNHGMKISGPALVDSASTSVLIGSDCNAEIDALGSILLTPASN
jgi:N-methylhydantoinase A